MRSTNRFVTAFQKEVDQTQIKSSRWLSEQSWVSVWIIWSKFSFSPHPNESGLIFNPFSVIAMIWSPNGWPQHVAKQIFIIIEVGSIVQTYISISRLIFSHHTSTRSLVESPLPHCHRPNSNKDPREKRPGWQFKRHDVTMDQFRRWEDSARV